MVLVSDNNDWCGTVNDIDETWKDLINSSIETENFRVEQWICMALTPFEEEYLKANWPIYYNNTEKYAGSFAAYCVFEDMCGMRYMRPTYMRPDADMVDWETGEEK